MKKITFLMMAIATVLGLGSCSEDRDPVYNAPTSFVLNTPAMQDQYIQLTEGNVLELVASQPDYGYAAVAQYRAQMSLTEDFAKAYDLEAADGTATKARFVVKQSDVAVGICTLDGIDSKEAYDAKYPDGMKPMKVYFRAIASLNGIEGSEITSNVVSYNQLAGYFAIPTPGFIYLVGSPEGWTGPTESNAAHYADWRLFEADDAIGSKVYTGVFDIPAAPTFRFYTALTGWDADSYGTQVDDNPIQFPEFAGGSFSSTVVKGKGSFEFPNWPGGKMTITVDMSDMQNITITCQEGEQSVVTAKYIYLLGTLSSWDAPEKANETKLNPFRLADTTGSGIYTGTYDVADAGKQYFRFALALSDSDGWNNPNQIGTQANDGDVDAPLSNNSFSGPYVKGKGNWVVDCPSAGKLTLIVDTNQQTVNFTFAAN